MTDEYKTASKDLPFAVLSEHSLDEQDKSVDLHQQIRRGDPCPICCKGYLRYNGVLNLECDHCGYTLAGCST